MDKKPKSFTKPTVAKAARIKLPPQSSAQDTRNWDNRQFNTPSGRVIIETDQTQDPKQIIAE